MKADVKKLNSKAKKAIIIVISTILFVSVILASMAFIYPANSQKNICLPDTNAYPQASSNNLSKDIKHSILSYRSASMESKEVAAILSDASLKVISYNASILEEAKKASKLKSQAATIATAASQTSVASNANLNGYESQVLALINSVRASNGLGPLAAVQSLTDVARSRSLDMLSKNYFSHYSPEGKNVFNFLREAGIGYSYGGENLAHSYPASAGSADAFMNAWLNSPTHRANLLRGEYTKVGIGFAENGDRRVVTTVFTN